MATVLDPRIVLAGWKREEYGRAIFEVMTDDEVVHQLYSGFTDEREYMIVMARIRNDELYVGQPLSIARREINGSVSSTWYPGCRS